ncbi:MAG TPA: hypothetical protein EYG03_16660 [Planctomycetes bacterium]|nr:hypothetical protein [Fuerstiella sp.]HIK93582.1 hypothetical protein [Planctomycetota bacterium]
MSSTLYSRSQLTPFAFVTGMVLFALAAMGLTAALPIGMSVAVVFLFAGPHNYVEARYFLTRLPARFGGLRSFFLFSAAGVVSLTIAFPLLTRIPTWFGWPASSVLWTVGVWNTGLILWGTHLVAMRAQQPPRRQWDYAWPIGIAVVGLMWLQPMVLPLLLVYLHPLMGLWVLDRELAQRRPEWHRSYRAGLLVVPVLLLVLWTVGPSSGGGGLAVPVGIRQQITQHAGAAWFSEFIGRRLIATHAFLELLHYGVWLVAIPLASGRVFAEGFKNIPLMKRSISFRRGIQIGLLSSVMVVGLLWLGFAADYSTTRDVYFTVATLHVLAEVPFLLRLL